MHISPFWHQQPKQSNSKELKSTASSSSLDEKTRVLSQESTAEIITNSPEIPKKLWAK